MHYRFSPHHLSKATLVFHLLAVVIALPQSAVVIIENSASHQVRIEDAFRRHRDGVGLDRFPREKLRRLSECFEGTRKSAVVQSLDNIGMQIVHTGVPGCPASYRDICKFVESVASRANYSQFACTEGSRNCLAPMSGRRLWFSRSGASTREFGPARQSSLDYPPNDPLFSSQQTLFEALRVEDTWRAIKSSGLQRKAVVLTLIDTGVTPGHPELEGRLLKEREAETYTKRSNAWGTGHGTMMAGIIASNTNNMVGLAGIADKVKIRSIRMKPCGLGDVSITQSLFAFEKALEMKETSVVVYAYGNRFTPATALIFDQLLKKVTKKGILVLVSSSNSDRVDSREEVLVPCSLANGIPGVLCVTATQAEESLVLARRVAKLASLGVPGTEVMSLTPERDGDEWLYGMFRGSSGATAAAAGIVALMKPSSRRKSRGCC